MNQKKYFTDYAEARAFYEAQVGDRSICSVRKELRAELGNWIVQYTAPEAEKAVEFTGKKLIARHNGKKATRATKNAYKAVVVAEDAAGKLVILSCHWDKAAALDTIANFNAGKFVNFNYRNKRATEPVLLEA